MDFHAKKNVFVRGKNTNLFHHQKQTSYRAYSCNLSFKKNQTGTSLNTSFCVCFTLNNYSDSMFEETKQKKRCETLRKKLSDECYLHYIYAILRRFRECFCKSKI